jgi:L-arabinose isomerase
MLEVCPTIAADQPACEIHPLSIGARDDPVRLVFDAAPGPAVVLGMADLGDRFRLVANEVDLVPPDEPLPRLPVARAVWRPRPDFHTSAESWLSAGGPHHTVLSTAVGAEELIDLAEMTRTELLLIDGSTTRAAFADRIRWNQAYYRLAQGL